MWASRTVSERGTTTSFVVVAITIIIIIVIISKRSIIVTTTAASAAIVRIAPVRTRRRWRALSCMRGIGAVKGGIVKETVLILLEFIIINIPLAKIDGGTRLSGGVDGGRIS
jgi:hypothetical protein